MCIINKSFCTWVAGDSDHSQFIHRIFQTHGGPRSWCVYDSVMQLVHNPRHISCLYYNTLDVSSSMTHILSNQEISIKLG